METRSGDVRMLVRTAFLALACAVMYTTSRAMPVALRWLKYFCPVTTALVDGGFGYRLRHVFVSALIIGLVFHPGEALSYFLLIGSFGLVFRWDLAPALPPLNTAASMAAYTLAFVGWIHAVPWIAGFTFEELAGGLLVPRYVLLKPILDAAGVSRDQFIEGAVNAALLTSAALGLTFYGMLYAANAFLLVWVKRALPRHPEPPDRHLQTLGKV
ncbi:MAG: hypothetical protein HPY55_06420 [Firmicutes bacterium]|nr:hypothetical protein [Bacillota bacterium]